MFRALTTNPPCQKILGHRLTSNGETRKQCRSALCRPPASCKDSTFSNLFVKSLFRETYQPSLKWCHATRVWHVDNFPGGPGTRGQAALAGLWSTATVFGDCS